MLLPLGDIHVGLDNGQGDLSFVSHAHGDHLNGIRKKTQKTKIIASEETLALADLDSSVGLPSGVRLHPAGHMLGARQISVENDGGKTVYTGDLSLHLTVDGTHAEIIECDRLILDATYADPSYVFPPYEDVVSEMARWITANRSSNIILGCYDMGKAQEMIRILNERCSIAPVVNERTEHISSVYEKFGVKLDRISIDSNEAEDTLGHPFVAIVNMRHAKRYFARQLEEAYGRTTLSAVATGWALHYRFNVDKGFPLSDHADFNGLKEYIAQSGAKKVEFHSGDGKALLKACGFTQETGPLFNV